MCNGIHKWVRHTTMKTNSTQSSARGRASLSMRDVYARASTLPNLKTDEGHSQRLGDKHRRSRRFWRARDSAELSLRNA